MGKILFTSESVTEGHPDKICDQISDAVLDAMLEQDPMSRVACETAITTGLVLVMGEVTSNAQVDIQKIVRDTICEIGYDDTKKGFDGNLCGVMVSLDKQSADIAMGVDKALEAKLSDEQIDAIGAGDQGMMFGYATNETDEYMPYPIHLAHKLSRQLTKVRKDGTLPYLRADGKSQVTVEYDENGNPIRLDAVVVSSQHSEDISWEQIKEDIRKHVIDVVLPAELIDEDTKIYINPTGRFVIGGPNGDSGVTGRKIIVDTYGGWARHGGGAFSGKDPTKVDRSAAYAARYVAKNIVAAGLCDRAEVQLSYAIGVAQPTSVRIDTFGTGKLPEEKLVDIITDNFDLRPAGIIQMLNLRRPIYNQTASYGHFGRNDLSLPKGTLSSQKSPVETYSGETETTAVFDELLYNKYSYDRNIQALYATFSTKVNNFGLQLGLRGEYTDTETKSLGYGETEATAVPYKDDYFSLFPSLFLSYSLPKNHEIQVNYTRRISRPRGWQLNPFMNMTDSLNISFGNPYLSPEYSNSFELNYIKTWEKHTLSVSTYYRNTDDVIQRIRYREGDVMKSTSANITQSSSAGAEIVAKNKLLKFLDFTTTLNFYYNELEGFSYLPAGADTPVTGERDDNFSWTGKIIANAMLPYAISLQATGSYNSKQIIAQGHREASYRLDLGARKFFFDRKINLSISVQDILNSRSWHSITSGNGFKQDSDSWRKGGVFRFTLSYNFGNMKASKQKQQRPSEEMNIMEEEF